jgi:hypothetical protein
LVGERKRKANAEFAESAEFAERRVGFNTEEEHRGHGEEEKQEKSRKVVALDHKNPPFPQTTRKGWGTLKYACRRRLIVSGAT